MRRHVLQASAGALLVAALVCVSAGVALAHVTVNPKSAVKGSYTVLTFRVPNEMDNANTTELDVQLLQNPAAPIPSVSVKPVPGWTAAVTNEELPAPVKTKNGEVSEAASVIKWTGGTVKPGEFQEFEISVGPLPSNVDQLIFPAVQVYSNGQSVRWVELQKPGQAEPAHPAPVLKLVDADAPAASAGTAAPAAQTGVTVAAKPASSSSSSSGLATVGVVLGAIGVLLGAAAVVLVLRNRQTASS
jgi:uncharacterized protein YcnI